MDSRRRQHAGLRLVQPGRAYPYFERRHFLGHSDPERIVRDLDIVTAFWGAVRETAHEKQKIDE